MDLENEELEKLYAESFQGIESGSVLTGTVVLVKPDSVIVDVGYKSEGVVKSSEFSEEELANIKPGDALDVFVVAVKDAEGVVVLSKDRARKIKAWTDLEDSFKDGVDIKGVIKEKTKGGLFVDIGDIRAFLPGSHADIRPIRDLDTLIGTESNFRIIKMNVRRSNIIVSRRVCLEEERTEKKAHTLEVLKEGAVMSGVVKNITDYGVFVDLGGIDGLLHISDISWGRISHPSKHFDVGQEVEVLVLSFDSETEKVTLGYKQKMEDPWERVSEKYPVGTRVEGKVVSLTDYGAFVEVEDALEGLVHSSEIEWSPRPKHPSKYLSVDDIVEAVVLKADRDERRLSLSLKQLKPSPWEMVSESYKVGQTINGKVRGITEFGAFVGLPEGVDGLVHISDISWTKHIKHPSDVLRKGQEVEAVVLSIEPDKERMALGIKQLTTDPWINDIPQKYNLGDEYECTVLRSTEHGVFVELEEDVEGLIYSSEMPADAPDLKEGQRVIAKTIKVDLANKKIGLSIKDVLGEVSQDAPDTTETAEAREEDSSPEETPEAVEPEAAAVEDEIPAEAQEEDSSSLDDATSGEAETQE